MVGSANMAPIVLVDGSSSVGRRAHRISADGHRSFDPIYDPTGQNEPLQDGTGDAQEDAKVPQSRALSQPGIMGQDGQLRCQYSVIRDHERAADTDLDP